MMRPVNSSGSHWISPIIFWICQRMFNVVNPGKFFHSNSIGSPSSWPNFLYRAIVVNHPICSFHFLAASVDSLSFPRHHTESENTWTFAVDNRTALLHNNVVFCHACEPQSIFVNPVISIWLWINLRHTLNNCWIVRSVWFLTTCKFCKLYVPRCTAASNVALRISCRGRPMFLSIFCRRREKTFSR